MGNQVNPGIRRPVKRAWRGRSRARLTGKLSAREGVHLITTIRSGDEQEAIKGGSVPTAKAPSPKGTFERSGGTQMKNG